MTKRVTLVPGAAGSSAFWAPIMARLPEAWDKRAFDLSGLGPIPAQPNINSYDDVVDDVARTISIPSAVVAQSMGSYIALQLALRYPRLVTALVLAAATCERLSARGPVGEFACSGFDRPSAGDHCSDSLDLGDSGRAQPGEHLAHTFAKHAVDETDHA